MGENSRENENSPLEGLAFRFPLRRYQQEILELIKLKLEKGERELHIVAPPGAGKTIIGLQLASLLKENTLIISPTTTIQAQWAEKLKLFMPVEQEEFACEDLLGTHESKPLKPITVLTYQVLSTPGREIEYLEKLAHKDWVEELASTGISKGDAEFRIIEILQNNPKAYEKEISRHTSRLRRKLTELLELKEVLHPNALTLVQALRRQKFKTVIFDECHHLTDYWAAIMIKIVKMLEDPIVIGLTGTPPEGKTQSQANRYLSLVGEIDYQVPTQALVKEGGLAPFQDLVYFTFPTIEEENFLAEQHAAFQELIIDLAESENSLLRAWVIEKVDAASKSGWAEFSNLNPDLSCALVRFLYKYSLPLPNELDFSEFFMQSPFIEDWICLLQDFSLNYLKLSASPENHELYERIRLSASKLGFGLTERGFRKQASPVDRVLAFSRNKAKAVCEILAVESRNLEDRLRAVVVTDFERMSATANKQTKAVLTEESGGAIQVMRELLANELSQFVNPCLVTGSLVYIDNRIAAQMKDAIEEMLEEESYDEVKLELIELEGELFSQLRSSSSAWQPRLYVGLVTRALERGISKVFIGTRGIFGEGWDCQSLNTLIDLTTTTTPVSVKQLRGRSIRLNTQDPLGERKVANNWDVVCIAPHLEKGLNDYRRFARKHAGYFGISDDGQIECGVGHVHASLSELSPAEIFANLDDLNQEMKLRALAREGIYDLWKVGQPYENKTLGCIEIGRVRKLNLTPPHIRQDLPYKQHARMLRANLAGVWLEYGAITAICSFFAYLLTSTMLMPAAFSLIPILVFLPLARRRYQVVYERLQKQICRPNSQESSLFDMARAVLSALQQTKFIARHVQKDSIKISVRSDGSYRIFLDDVDYEQSQYFVKSFRELMEPMRKQPYLIPKYEYSFPQARKGKAKELPGEASTSASTSTSTEKQGKGQEQDYEPGEAPESGSENPEKKTAVLTSNQEEYSEDRFFQAYLKGRAEPQIAAYYPVPSMLARSEKGREAFQSAWNKYVSPGFIVATETKPELLNRYFGLGASLAQRLLWE